MTVGAVPGLEWQWPRPDSAVPAAQVLGVMRFGAAAAPADDLPCLDVATAALVPADGWQAAWTLAAELEAGRHGEVSYRRGGGFLFGTLRVREADFAGGDPAGALQRAAAHAYRQLFAAVDALGHYGLLRVWNYLPRINAVEHGSERYRQFNAGRQDAFAACGRALAGEVPAACALGSAGGDLVVAFLACTGAPRAVENPRQVSAYHYPPDYGVRSPTFARATLLQHAAGTLLFVSGTASIVGHRTVHPGDVRAQTRETLANIDAVLDEAARVGGGRRLAAGELAYIAYLRHPADLAAVRAEVEARIGTQAAVAYVQADVCRADLLVEIEASGGHPIQGL